MPIKLSIVIISFNVSDCLRKCIDSIYENSGINSLEIIVVDNASVDDSCDMIRNNYLQVKLIENKNNQFVPKANNQGIKASRGKYILLLNPDTIILPQSLKIMVGFLEDNLDVSAIGPKLKNIAGEYEYCVSLRRTFNFFLYNLTYLGKIFKKKTAKINQELIISDWQRDTDRDAELMIDVCMMIRRNVLEKTGLYDVAFKLYFAEDDLCNRIIEHGHRIRFLSSVSCIHLRHISVNTISKAKIVKIRQEDAITYAKKYFGPRRAIILRLMMILTNFIRNIRFYQG